MKLFRFRTFLLFCATRARRARNCIKKQVGCFRGGEQRLSIFILVLYDVVSSLDAMCCAVRCFDQLFCWFITSVQVCQSLIFMVQVDKCRRGARQPWHSPKQSGKSNLGFKAGVTKCWFRQVDSHFSFDKQNAFSCMSIRAERCANSNLGFESIRHACPMDLIYGWVKFPHSWPQEQRRDGTFVVRIQGKDVVVLSTCRVSQ